MREPRRTPFLRKPLPLLSSNTKPEQPSSTKTSTATTYNAIPLEVSSPKEEEEQQQQHSLKRHLTLPDLIAIGVGGTVGSGLFVLAGLVSHQYAGPASVLSWAIAGLAALLSGCSYAELSSRIPLAGGAYAYCFVALGEWPAFLAAVCLSLEYVAASAAVSRSWGDKFSLWLLQQVEVVVDVEDQAEEQQQQQHWLQKYLNVEGTVSPPAFVLSVGIVTLLLMGVKESKQATNVFTGLKVVLVFFMIGYGALFVQPANWTPFFPASLGVSGMFRGATGTFFGYLGYDQLCGLAGEAINPKRNLPLAIIFTLCFVAVIYMSASLVLCGMQPWQHISPVAGFPVAFGQNGANLAGQITALGEIITLPIVTLITVAVQPRLQYAMAQDGLLPAYFLKIDDSGNLWNGTLVAGLGLIAIASVVPFQHLNDVISCAILVVLGLTNSSVILLWHEAPEPESDLAHHLMFFYHVICLITCSLLNSESSSYFSHWATIFSGAITAIFPFMFNLACPRTKVFGGSRQDHYHEEQILRDDGYFRTPFLPFLPCAAIFINYYLLVQLELLGKAGLLVCLGLSSLYYFFGATHERVWKSADESSGEEDQLLCS